MVPLAYMFLIVHTIRSVSLNKTDCFYNGEEVCFPLGVNLIFKCHLNLRL